MNTARSDNDQINRLKDILLREDRKELEEIKGILENRQMLLSERVIPIIEERLDFFKQHFPREFQLVVEKIIDQRLDQSRTRLLQILYPVLGKMIRKYINHQFILLREQIEAQLRRGILGRVRAWAQGVKESELVLNSLDRPMIEEIYLIQRDSGLLLGSASLRETIDKELIAGMLTAIKSFVEDAFRREDEDLEMIQYGTYQILIQNFYNYYIAMAISGSLSAGQREKLSETILNFAGKEMVMDLKTPKLSTNLELKKKLEKYFIEPQRITQTRRE